ncbi:hypothetical protein CLV30_12033 [Haloactinopolyspora alba]|uniref:Uncharacterized protein n=1 Tax=Haloactinopolyspora alba TaxID=648780 RepID=A0A2P8DM18_9ACTN|nr:hypothetical protein CLV30_12033 [Haloactinopolyspora alba]
MTRRACPRESLHATVNAMRHSYERYVELPLATQ